MKRTLLFIACVLATLSMMAQDELTIEDKQNSGCLAKTRGEESEPIPTIVLTKEGSVLSVQLLNYNSNCATTDFIVTPTMSSGSELYSMNISVFPSLPDGELPACLCPYNVSFTVRDVEANSFYLSCWWYNGKVELTEGEPMVLEYKAEDVSIDDKTEINEQNFPDENFRNYVLSTTIDRNQNRILEDDEILHVTDIDVHQKKIVNLKGIEYFKELHKLICYQNDLTELDLSACAKLDTLHCAGNKLTVLNLSNCSKLKWIRCDQNQLSELDASACTELKLLVCSSNKITTLDVSACRKLVDFQCHYNNLTKLDVSNNMELVKLYCYNNQLTELDLSNNTKLENCNCSVNRLTKLILSKDNVLIALPCFQNQLRGTAMDHIIENLNEKQAGLICVYDTDNKDLEKNVCTTTQVAAIRAKGWNVYQWLYDEYHVYDGSTSTDDYRPLLEEGKVWKYYNNVRQYMKSLTISGDTIIGNQTYKKIIDVSSKAVEMLLREEDKKVYCCYPNRDTEILLYDFGKNAGDIISKEIEDEDIWIRKVISVDTVMVKGNAFRCMTVDEYIIHGMTEEEFFAGNYGYSTGFWIEGIGSFTYLDSPIPLSGNYYTFYECSIGDMTFKQKDFLDNDIDDNLPEYRPFVEDDKVWKVGDVTSGNPVQLVDYYFFDNDTIINGKTCKQMMRQRYVSPEHPNYDYLSQEPSLIYVGAWYEEDKKVYEYDTTLNQFTLMYDFSLDEGGIFQKDGLTYVIGPKQTGFITGFKGVQRNVWLFADGENFYSTPWLEGVGGLYCPTTSVYPGYVDPHWFMMECYVGDEVIYLNDECEDGATPELSGARKHRFDFTHTTKIQPKSRMRSEAEPSLYGEYNEQQLSIHLDPINDAYQVSITDASGKVAYEKTINAGNIVGLNIDISSYPKGYYNVTVENDNESFTGTFEAQTTGIMDVRKKAEEAGDRIYNLQGQRLNSLQKGLNIVNGQKVYVK